MKRQWTTRGAIRDEDLPQCVLDALNEAREARPGTHLTCIAFRTLEGGREIARMGPGLERTREWSQPGLTWLYPPAKDWLVLSVTVTETTFETVRNVTHVLVALTRRVPNN